MPIGTFLDKNHPPDESELRAALGDAYPFWQRLVQFIQSSYDLTTDLSYGGKNYGWNLWYRKSSKALTSLFPAQEYVVALVVLGRLELEKAMADTWTPPACTMAAGCGCRSGTQPKPPMWSACFCSNANQSAIKCNS